MQGRVVIGDPQPDFGNSGKGATTMCHTTLQGKDTDLEMLAVALELSAKTWKVALGARGRTRQVNVPAGNLAALFEALAKTKQRWGLDPTAPVVMCYEAGRDGFWIHRALEKAGVKNLVVDSASIEVNRRQKQAKTDRLDATRLLTQLQRFHGGEQGALRAVVIPKDEDEDARRPHRELERLKKEQTAHGNRMRSLFTLHGYELTVGARVVEQVDELGERLPPRLRAEVLREYERWQLVHRQILQLGAELRKELEQEDPDRAVRLINQLMELRGLGPGSCPVLVHELFGWRHFDNRRQLGAAVGLVGMPYASGTMDYEQGISKSGNRQVRRILIELAWNWLRYQPDSPLSLWFQKRFAGSARLRRIGIVALARRLLIDLWLYLRDRVIPEGVRFTSGVVPEGVQVKPATVAAAA